MSTLENPMVSQLQDEATPSSQLLALFFLLCKTNNWIPLLQAAQAVRQTAVRQPIPDCAYISSNLPPARHMPLTTASKIVRASRVLAEKKKKAAKAKSKSKKGTNGEK